MGSVIDYIDCPNCKQEAFSDYYYRTGEQYVNCAYCGYHYSVSIKRDENGNMIKLDESKELAVDNVVREEFIIDKPYGSFRIKNQGSVGEHSGSLKDKEEYDRFVSDIVSLTNQENTIESCVVSRLVDGSIVREVLVGDIYYFDDWVNEMLNHSDYSESELLDFEEYYQNLLTFEENSDNFEKQLNN
jgi:Zn ribbon nucleic-acid-binding protein